ncbi:MAG: SRPBCC domain-containing protein [Agriterribacter sp.]
MPQQNEMLPNDPDRVITTVRNLRAKREEVFNAWADPALLQQWWGPKGFTNTFENFNFTEGGNWKFVMHGPNGGDYKNECIFLKIDKPSLIAWDHISNPVFKILILLVEKSDTTEVSFNMIFATAEECNKVKGFAPAANEENFDRLEQLLYKGAVK